MVTRFVDHDLGTSPAFSSPTYAVVAQAEVWTRGKSSIRARPHRHPEALPGGGLDRRSFIVRGLVEMTGTEVSGFASPKDHNSDGTHLVKIIVMGTSGYNKWYE